MTTLNIILAVCLILLSAAAALLTVRAMKMQSEAESQLSELAERHQQLDREEIELQKKYNDISAWEDRQKQDAKRISKAIDNRRKIYANFEVLDSDENKPDKKAIGKSLSSKIGYALRKEFPDIKERHDTAKGGRTVYSIDFYVTPCE